MMYVYSDTTLTVLKVIVFHLDFIVMMHHIITETNTDCVNYKIKLIGNLNKHKNYS